MITCRDVDESRKLDCAKTCKIRVQDLLVLRDTLYHRVSQVAQLPLLVILVGQNAVPVHTGPPQLLDLILGPAQLSDIKSDRV